MTVSALKAKKIEELEQLLADRSDFILTSYSGLGVPKQNDLRFQLKEKKGVLKVVKNNLFYLALKKTEAYAGVLDEIEKDLKGPTSVAFAVNDFSTVSKVLLEYAKKEQGLSIKSGCLDGAYLPLNEVKELALLPSRGEMLVIIGRGLNTPATKIAKGIKEIMSSLGRGIQAIGKKNG